MKNISALIHYLKNDIEPDNVQQAAVVLHLLQHGGRATRESLIHTLSSYNPSLNFYYEQVLNRLTESDLADQDVFTYEPNSENYFLNVSLKDVYLVEQAIKLCNQHINAWQARQADETQTRGLPKLVRDRIPEIITASGRTPTTEIASGDDLHRYLLDKLTEEHLELLIDPSIEEIADMIEVLLALAKQLGYDEAITLTHTRQKRAERGGFDGGYILTEINTPETEGETS